MGSFGTGPFDNDAGADFLDELSSSPSRALTRTLKALGKRASDEYLDIDDAAAGWAACELVALAHGYGVFSTLEGVVIDALVKLKAKEEQRQFALEILPRIGKSRVSELADLWEEAGDTSLLTNLLKDLKERLEAASAGPRDIPKAEVGDIICFPAPDNSSEWVVFQVASSREVLVFEDKVKEKSEARKLTKSGQARRVITSVNALFHQGEVVGKSPVRKEFKEKKLYADECGTFHEYCLHNANGGKFTEVGYDEALQYNRWQRHTLLSLLQVPVGTCNFRVLRSPDERESADRKEKKENWLGRRKGTPGPFDDEHILGRILSGIEEEGVDAFVERYHSNSLRPRNVPDLDFFQFSERLGYIYAGLVAVWRNKSFADSFPVDVVSRFPSKPSEEAMPLAVEAAHIYIERVIALDADLRLVEENLFVELRCFTDTIQKALGDYDKASTKSLALRKESVRAFTTWFRKGFETSAQGDKAGGIAFYEQALGAMLPQGEYNTLVSTYCYLMGDYAAVGRLDEARTAYEELLKLRSQVRDESSCAFIWNHMAWYLYEHGSTSDLVEALEFVEASLEVCEVSESSDVYDTKIRLLLRMGREQEAVAVLSQALALAPKHAALKDAKDNWAKLSAESD